MGVGDRPWLASLILYAYATELSVHWPNKHVLVWLAMTLVVTCATLIRSVVNTKFTNACSVLFIAMDCCKRLTEK